MHTAVLRRPANEAVDNYKKAAAESKKSGESDLKQKINEAGGSDILNLNSVGDTPASATTSSGERDFIPGLVW